jgi:Peptidase family M28
MFIKKIKTLFVFCFLVVNAFAQQADKLLNTSEALRIESFLASDELKGRKTGTVEIDKAADFIADEFKKAGLKNYTGLTSYKQNFTYVKAKFISTKATIDSTQLEESSIITITCDSNLLINQKSVYSNVLISKEENLLQRAEQILKENKNQIVWVNKFFTPDFRKLKRFKRDILKTKNTVVFILWDNKPDKFDVEIKHKITETNYTNVVGVLPGKSKKNEFVLFSGHYDHLGMSKTPIKADSIYNGANDDAAGTAAVIMLANYFSKLNTNERTLIFVAFTAEEIGGFGSQYFSSQINADKVVAMFNLEMIGTESKWGKNSAYITGYDKSDFGKILQKNLQNTAFHFEPDPYTKENLFYRSDNATLAAFGVPAHTISTSKMDVEPNYHKLTDEVSTLDIANMTEVIKAIALSSKTIVSGKDTPSRIEKIN